MVTPAVLQKSRWQVAVTARTATKEELTEVIGQMRAREIKEELEKAGVSTVGMFDKEELMQRLVELRLAGASSEMASQAPDENVVAVVDRTWRQAHDDTKRYEAQLQAIMSNASAMIVELDSLFLDSAPIPVSDGRAARPETESEEASRRGPPSFESVNALLSTPQVERVIPPEEEEETPILAGGWATGAAIKGNFSSSPSLVLPARRYKPDMLAGAKDDVSASDDENALWSEALGLVVDNLDMTYCSAEQLVADVAAAEVRAEERRDTVVGDFRKRVIQQIIYATDGAYTPDEIEPWLTTLQTDDRLRRYLALLERSAREAEGLQAEIRRLQGREVKQREGSRVRENTGEAVRESFYRTRSLDTRIRACLDAAKELPETLDAYDKLGEAWDSINPFKIFR